jgi:hypothetical protein
MECLELQAPPSYEKGTGLRETTGAHSLPPCSRGESVPQEGERKGDSTHVGTDRGRSTAGSHHASQPVRMATGSSEQIDLLEQIEIDGKFLGLLHQQGHPHSACPLYPRKRTFSEAAQMSAKCQKRTFSKPRQLPLMLLRSRPNLVCLDGLYAQISSAPTQLRRLRRARQRPRPLRVTGSTQRLPYTVIGHLH